MKSIAAIVEKSVFHPGMHEDTVSAGRGILLVPSCSNASLPAARRSAVGSCTVPYVLTVVAFFIALQLCLAASARGDGNMGSTPVTITKEHQGQVIAAPLGSMVQIELPFLGSAGYGWHIANMDTGRLALVREETKRISEDRRVGGPVMGCWYFRTIAPGRAEIRMALYRAWEGPDAATERFTVTIEIK